MVPSLYMTSYTALAVFSPGLQDQTTANSHVLLFAFLPAISQVAAATAAAAIIIPGSKPAFYYPALVDDDV